MTRETNEMATNETAAGGPKGDSTLTTIRELAGLLKVSERQVRRLDSAGKLPASIRVGSAKRWRSDELDAWIGAGCPDRDAWNAIRATASRRRES
jgi:excisionase family DNA binding protein